MNEYDDEQFRQNFRCSRRVFNEIYDRLELHWNYSVQLKHALLIFLWDVGTGECHRSITSRFGVSSWTVSKHSIAIGTMIIENLSYYMSYKLSTDEILEQQYSFGQKYNIPSAICAMDGVFMPLKRPAQDGEEYYSGHKKNYGVTNLVVCDSNYRILFCKPGNPGKVGDSLIFSCSEMKEDITNGNSVFGEDVQILVDSAFTNYPFVIKLTVRIGSGSARVIIEHCFGQFKQMFRLFLTKSELPPSTHTIKLYAAMIIFNMIKKYDR